MKKIKIEISEIARKEQERLKFWKDNKIFEKSIENIKKSSEFIFYDGPPFGTGLPHYGHIVPGTIKDVFPRYQTMKGKKVTRNWGWDCHGLPVENMIEKEIGLNSKADIEKYGINKFNSACCNSVLKYKKDWEDIIPKTGRWVDMQKDYKTMDSSYTESIWWAFSELNKKGLIYKGFKSMHLCPRCETTLSNSEVAEGYKNIKDISITVKFKLNPRKDESQGIDTFILAWTTTPWTLPGNVALAVGENIDYVKIKKNNEEKKGQIIFILAKEKLEEVFNNSEYEVISEFKGSELVGLSYEPLFNHYLKNNNLKNKENGWKIYSANFVNIETGTGIVHIAPAFGEDDLKMREDYKLPWIQHVGIDGKFKKELGLFSEMQVRKKDFHNEADIEVIKYLAGKSLLFSKLKIEHSYPHCWRCDTPLLNYATDSWFIETTKIKDELVAENLKINWIPENIGRKRFHNWLENTRDWAISRSRYWGAPLPIWENKTTGAIEIIGSLEELKAKTKSTNSFIFLRHGESESNIKHNISTIIGDDGDKLTDQGREQAKKARLELTDIDLIYSSPFERTKQTAEIIALENKIEIIFDERIREINPGLDNNGKLWSEVEKKDYQESYLDVKKRVMEFMYEIDQKYENKNILIVSHGIVGLSLKEFSGCNQIKNAYPYKIDFAPIPHNENYELDFHRPYIDEISWKNEQGEKYEFIKEVFDCWFESGSMPFASKHYPFENTNIFNPEKNIGFPADFISEGLDQTRGWFYSMLVISYALFQKSPYKNVIVHGMLMAEDGRKMSKSLKNYPPMEKVLNKYGSDALRLFLMSSPIVRAESPLFSEKLVDESLKKIVLKANNILSFYKMFENERTKDLIPEKSKNILDQWILIKTNELLKNVSEGLETYVLDKATREFANFIDDLSVWYLRRSRDRFKGNNQEDKDFALATLKKVLDTLAKTIAPFAPFLAEDLYLGVHTENRLESVHLEDWPENKKNIIERIILPEGNILEKMVVVREIVSLGLEQRSILGIKVRQPLAGMKVFGTTHYLKEIFKEEQFLEIIKDELNIKEINLEIIDVDLKVKLDPELTAELKKEGDFREFLRLVQTMRKKAGLEIKDEIELKIDIAENQKDFIAENLKELKKTAGVTNINYLKIDSGEIVKINEIELKVVLLK